MKKTRILISLGGVFLCLMMLLAIGASADSSSGESGGILWALSDEGVLTISPNPQATYATSGQMDGFYGGQTPWKASSVKEVVIKDGVTNIGSYAFMEHDQLTKVSMGKDVTSIDGEAFYGCDKLADVTIGTGVTSIGSYAFYNCDKLATIVIPDCVQSIGYWAFAECDVLTEFTFPSDLVF